MKNWRPIILLGMAFMCGILVGIFTARYYVQKKIEKTIESPISIRFALIDHLSHALKLNKQQKEQLTQVITMAHQQLYILRTKHDPEIDIIMNNLENETLKFLTSDQQKAFEKLIQSRKKNWKEGLKSEMSQPA